MQTANFLKFRSKCAFTLIELLTVVAIIAILAGILIPTVAGVKTAANKSRTKNQFGQWSVAMEGFKSTYGYYPSVDTNKKIKTDLFIGALSAKKIDGSSLTTSKEDRTARAGNDRLVSFCQFTESDISDVNNGDVVGGSIKDAFGNTDIVVITDRDGDGRIHNQNSNNEGIVSVIPVANTTSAFTPKDFPTNGVRSGVIFYSAGKGSSEDDIVTSW